MDYDLIIIIGVPLVIGIVLFLMNRYHIKRIEEKVADIGGTVLPDECRWIWTWTSKSPFKFVTKNQPVYYFRYEIDFEVKEGWVKFRLFLGPDWRL